MEVRLDELELRHLHALRAVASAGTFGRAAAQLGFTQSAISQQIASLERVVGTPVFDRPGGPRPVRLTPAGELLLHHAGAVLERVAAAEVALGDLLAGETGEIALGTFQSTSVRIVPNLVSCLREHRPGITLRLVELDEDEALQHMLRAGELDLSFLLGDPGDTLRRTHVLTDPFVLLAPLDSSIVPPEGPVPLNRVSGLPLIGQTTNACQGIIEDQLVARGIEQNIVFRSGDNAAIQALVAAGTGHAIQPLLAVDASDPRILVRDLDPPLAPREIYLAYAADRQLPPAVEEIVELVVTYCRSGELHRN